MKINLEKNGIFKNLLPALLIFGLLSPSFSFAQKVESVHDENIIPIYFFLITEDPPSIVAITPVTEDIIVYAIVPLDIATTTLTYDANGNLTGDGIFTYAWDYRNRLTQSGNGIATSTYAYDHEGNRVKLVEGATTTIFPNFLYSTTTGATGTTTKHVFGNGSMLATIEKAGSGDPTTRYIHTDHLGGSNVVTDSTGVVVQTLDYYPSPSPFRDREYPLQKDVPHSARLGGFFILDSLSSLR